MKRLMIVSALTMAMLMPSLESNAQAQGRGRNHERVERREVRGRNNSDDYRQKSKRDRRPDRMAHAPKHKDRHDNHFVPRGGRLVKCAPPRISRGCYVPGWEGRVRYHHDGRWGYYVNGAWRYYNCYYNPYDFFCEPVPVHVPHSRTVCAGHSSAGEVAAGVVAGTILGCIIGSMAN